MPRFLSKMSMRCLAGRHELSVLKFLPDHRPHACDYHDIEGLMIAALQSRVC